MDRSARDVGAAFPVCGLATGLPTVTACTARWGLRGCSWVPSRWRRLRVEELGEVVTLRGDGEAMLVRPDGHLAWRGTDEDGLRAWLDRALGTRDGSPDTVTDDWRARKKAATKQSIQEHALRLFMEKGYDATTVEEIAAAAGVSHMTFFRYFPRKEEVVEYDEYDPLMEDLIVARPPDEPPLVAVHQAIRRRTGAGPGEPIARRCSSGPGLCCTTRCCDLETWWRRTRLASCSRGPWPGAPALPSLISRPPFRPPPCLA